MTNIVPMRPTLPRSLTREAAADLVRQVLAESGNVQWSEHARDQMQARGVTDVQVMHVLRRGEVTRDPVFGSERNWELTLEEVAAGERIRVAVALDVDRMGFLVVVVTVVVL